MQTAARVTVIPPTLQLFSSIPIGSAIKKRVAAYARVSTDNDEQLNSYEAQVDHYTRYIQSNSSYELVEVYSDEGISATSTKKRDGFNRMIKDALDGKIDLIITKSVSRFARNTVDTLTTVRQLKEKGVEVYFEKENIFTLDSKGELLITIMSSLAQEESRSISENVTWGQRKRMKDGKVSMPYARFLGYEKGEDGLPKIVEEEARVVRLIYKLFLEGKTPSGIAKHLTDSGIPTPGGKVKWQTSAVLSIISNEKYAGNALLQKGFTVDFLTKKRKVNQGEIPQYYVENSHPAIVSQEVYDLAQLELKRRKESGLYYSGNGPFASKIICGDCGQTYGSKVWHSTSKYRRIIWQCNSKYKNGHKCGTPHIYEDDLKRAFISVFNSMIYNKAEFVAGYSAILDVVTETNYIDRDIEKLQAENHVVMELMRVCVQENAHTAQDQEEYVHKYTALVGRYQEIKDRLGKLTDKRQERIVRRGQMKSMLHDLEQRETLLDEFDEDLWYATIETVTVKISGELVFRFRDGHEVVAMI